MSVQLEISIINDPGGLASAAAALFATAAIQCVHKKNKFMTAISGGSTPRQSHRLLAEKKYSSVIPWHGVHLFWVDDRCVEQTDPASNYGAAKNDFIDTIGLGDHQVYPMPTTMEPEQGAVEYKKTIVSAFSSQAGLMPRFDLIFLGMGTDGHTGSLFPGQYFLWDKEEIVLAVRGGVPDVDRLTMNFSLINQAKHVVILVSGQAKAGLVKEIFTSSKEKYPVQLVKPVQGKITWLIDRDAAKFIPKRVRESMCIRH